jgi:hypothetical protein
MNMAVGTYFDFTSVAPQDRLGFLTQVESRVRMGTEKLFGALEVSSWTYSTYQASIGLQVGKSVDFGQVTALSFTHTPAIQPVDTINIQQPSIYTLTGEETSLSVAVLQFDPELVRVAIGSGVMYNLANERLITFGGACSTESRPIEVVSTNIGCDAPNSPDVGVGIYAIALTLYDCICVSGFQWDNMSAREYNVMTLEFRVRPVLALPLGNRLGNLYII